MRVYALLALTDMRQDIGISHFLLYESHVNTESMNISPPIYSSLTCLWL